MAKKKNTRTANIVLAIGGLNGFVSTEVQNSTFVLRINSSAKNPAHRQYAARLAEFNQNMLRIYLIPIIILCSISVFGQNRICKDYEIGNSLNESFKNVEKNNIEKGIELLSKVQNCKNLKNYSSYSLFSNFIEALIFNKQKDYDNALKALNSMEEGFLHKSKDSLVVETLFLKFGKEKVLNSFRNISRIESNPNKANVYSVYLNEIDYQFNFNSNEGGWCKYDDNGNLVSIYKPTEIINEKLDSVAKCTSFYMILKE